ncbi:MAG TPA: hypothetical protein ENG51_20480 [Deltaproteobacteria bacterium]|nr:hypothetical protein [Deltaproteobacteria bacterium]
MGAKRPTCEECRPPITERAAEAFELFQLCLPSFSFKEGIDYTAIETVLKLAETEEKRQLFELILVCFEEFIKIHKPKETTQQQDMSYMVQ